MRKLFPRVVGLFLTCLCFVAHGYAQDPRIAAREAEWKSYAPVRPDLKHHPASAGGIQAKDSTAIF